MKLKKLFKGILFPHIAIMIVLLPVSVSLLVYSFAFMEEESAVSYVSYFVSAYTLTVWCLKIPCIIRFFKSVRRENRYAKKWFEDVRLRVKVSLFASLIWNTVYAVFQLCLGVYHTSLWYYSTAVYYISLALMRFFLFGYTRKYQSKENMRYELTRYRICGWIFLVINLALSVMIILMAYQKNITFEHHEITTIAMAAYTFVTFTVAIVSLIKYRKYASPVYSAAKAINLAAAGVSMVTLTGTMVTTFSEGSDGKFRQIMILSVGAGVSVYVILMSLYMIIRATKQLKKFNLRVSAQDKEEIK